mmetsp:Transcript_46539/g.131571  ORF Transcript_46539/g.131571 Transcript_46539/m.131571 type:complete len:117 (-) Transcript_46539:131-481(-)
MAQGGEEKTIEEYKSLWGARILWPPDIPDNMLEDAVKTAMAAVDEFGKTEKEGAHGLSEKEVPKIAEKIKKHFDEQWMPYWHVTVGKNFGCHAVHEKQRFLYFYIEQFAFMIYKAQ